MRNGDGLTCLVEFQVKQGKIKEESQLTRIFTFGPAKGKHDRFCEHDDVPPHVFHMTELESKHDGFAGVLAIAHGYYLVDPPPPDQKPPPPPQWNAVEAVTTTSVNYLVQHVLICDGSVVGMAIDSGLVAKTVRHSPPPAPGELGGGPPGGPPTAKNTKPVQGSDMATLSKNPKAPCVFAHGWNINTSASFNGAVIVTGRGQGDGTGVVDSGGPVTVCGE